MMDMGPYYLTALVNLLGRVEGLTGVVSKSFEKRTITSMPKYGQDITVETPTHVNGILRFANGAVGTITTTFDVYYDSQAALEVYGTKGTLRVPDPNGFGGSIWLLRPEDGSFKEMPLLYDYKENSRGLGVADMAKALREEREFRADVQQTLHVLEILTTFEKSSQEGRTLDLASPYERRAAMPDMAVPGILD